MTRIKIDQDKLESIVDALQEASDHLDYCNYGDIWERCVNEGDDPLSKRIKQALSAGNKALEDIP